MCIGPEEGCHEVPEPMAPIDIMFPSLEPTRIPMSSPDITINGPMFVVAIPGMPAMSFFASSDGWPLAGAFMSIPGISLCDVLGEALGAAAGIFIPGCISCEGFGAGEDTPAGIFIPGLISCDGLGEGDATAAGIFIPGCISCDGTEDGDGDVAG